jgi:hypothetical protein
MFKKILLTALLGGIVMFMWEGLAHEVLGLGEAGVRGLDHEAAVVANIKDNVKEPGLYIFPGGEMLNPSLTAAQKEAATKKAMEQYRAGPSGIMVVHPEGIDAESPRHFIDQCLFDVLVMLVAAILLALATGITSFGGRLLFVTLIGLVPTLNAEFPYWNWYGFPTVYIMSQALIHLVGFMAAGLVAAWLMKPSTAA